MAIRYINKDSGSVAPHTADDMAFESFIGLQMPLESSESSGSVGNFESTRYTTQALKENVKNLLFTQRRERIFNSRMGIDWNRFFFQQMGPELKREIRAEISEQITTYLPMVRIRKVSLYDYNGGGRGTDDTGLGILLVLEYSGDIVPIHLTLSGNNTPVTE